MVDTMQQSTPNPPPLPMKFTNTTMRRNTSLESMPPATTPSTPQPMDTFPMLSTMEPTLPTPLLTPLLTMPSPMLFTMPMLPSTIPPLLPSTSPLPLSTNPLSLPTQLPP